MALRQKCWRNSDVGAIFGIECKISREFKSQQKLATVCDTLKRAKVLINKPESKFNSRAVCSGELVEDRYKETMKDCVATVKEEPETISSGDLSRVNASIEADHNSDENVLQPRFQPS